MIKRGMKYDFDRLIDRKGTHSIKWEFMGQLDHRADGDTLPMWVADMDFACPPQILEAIRKRTDREILGYSSEDTRSYWDAVEGWFRRRYQWSVPREHIMISPGVVVGLKYLVRTLTDPGEGIIIQRPVYYPFGRVIEENGRNIINNPLVCDKGYYRMDFKDLEKKASRKETTMMILCSPHNPVGRVWTEEELKRVGDICLANRVILVSDEIHADIVRTGRKHLVAATLFPREDRIITCTAPSKTFNTAGLLASHIIIPRKEHRKAWNREGAHVMLNPLSIAAVESAYTRCDDWVEQMNAYVDGNMEAIGEFLKRELPLARYNVPEGTYLAWINLEKYGYGPEELATRMVKKGKVLFDMGPLFGREGEGFLRMNAACPRSILTEGLRRLKRAMD